MRSVRKRMGQYGIRPRKGLGQSFLEDMNVMHRIVDLASPAADETVVEIGAGLGFMTEALAKRAGRVIAIEIDPRLAALLRERFAQEGRVEVVEGDVLRYDFSSPLPGGRVKVVGNIPYNISSPILFRLLDFRQSISSMVLMIQKELADRISASPGRKEYGIPSVLVARHAEASTVMTVPPSCFYPVPEVVSSVLRIVFRQGPDSPEGGVFVRIVRIAFARRRKTLLNNLRQTGLPHDAIDQVFGKSGIDGTRRAETLSVEEFSRLASAWIEIGADKLLDSREGI